MFIVAAAPCALVISIPITLVAALGTGARKGVLIKGGVYVEELAKVTVVALDKTGTITRGDPEVTDVIPVVPVAPSGDARCSPSPPAIESRSQHPLARAIVRHAEEHGVTPAAITDFRSLTGAGATARVNGRTVYVGSPDLFEQELGRDPVHGIAPDIARLQGEGKTVVLVGDERAQWALLAIRDNVRPNAKAAIRALHEAGVQKVVMLTGDNERTAQAIAARSASTRCTPTSSPRTRSPRCASWPHATATSRWSATASTTRPPWPRRRSASRWARPAPTSRSRRPTSR